MECSHHVHQIGQVKYGTKITNKKSLNFKAEKYFELLIQDEICDIAWSPHSATIFGTVSSVGKLEIWDLECSVLDPTIVHSVAEGKLNTINFGSHSPVVLTGDNDGNVNVFKICKGSKKNTASPDGSGTIDDTADGIISPVANLPSHHANHQQWKAAEAKRLLKIIHSRTTTPTQ